MFTPVVVWIEVEQRPPVKGLATGMQELELEISVLEPVASRLDEDGPIAAGDAATVTFHSDEYGDSPPVASIIRGVTRSEHARIYSVEISNWPALAEFWGHILHRFDTSVSGRRRRRR